MSKNEIIFVVGLAGALSSAIGFAIGQRKKLNDISAKIDKSIDEMSKSVEVDVSEKVVNEAVKKAVAREVEEAVSDAARSEAKGIVESYRKDISDRIKRAIEAGINQTDMDQIKQNVINKASDRCARRVTEGLDYIFDDFRRNLRRMTDNAIRN